MPNDISHNLNLRLFSFPFDNIKCNDNEIHRGIASHFWSISKINSDSYSRLSSVVGISLKCSVESKICSSNHSKRKVMCKSKVRNGKSCAQKSRLRSNLVTMMWANCCQTKAHWMWSNWFCTRDNMLQFTRAIDGLCSSSSVRAATKTNWCCCQRFTQCGFYLKSCRRLLHIRQFCRG